MYSGILLDIGTFAERMSNVSHHFLQRYLTHARQQNIVIADKSRFCINMASERDCILVPRRKRFRYDFGLERTRYGGFSNILWVAICSGHSVLPVVLETTV